MRRALVLLAVAMPAPVAAQAPAGLPVITSVCHAGTTVCKSPPYVLQVRRGVTGTLVYKGKNIAQMTKVHSPVATVTGTRVRSYACGDSDCVEMSIAVSSSFDLGTNNPVRLTLASESGASISNHLAVLRLGRIESFTASPQSPPWGTPVTVTVRGSDIGNALVSVMNSTVSNVSSSDDRVTFVATGTGAHQSSTPFTIRENTAGTPAETAYRPAVALVSLQIPYGAATVACGAPLPLFPSDGGVLRLGADGHAAIQWRTVVGARQYRWEVAPVLDVELAGRTGVLSTATVADRADVIARSGTVAPAIGATTVTATTPVVAGRRYKWRARAADCGDSAPWSPYRLFTTQ